jgi:replicative DNA helicase
MTVLADRLPPQSLDAEQATLGAALISRTAVERVLEMLERNDFYLEAHRRLYDVIAHLAERDQPVDLVSVTE